VAYGDRPVLKLSPKKVIAPGPKQVFRLDRMPGDIVGLRDEAPPPGTRSLLVRVMAERRRLAASGEIEAQRARLESDLAELPESARQLRKPSQPPVHISPRLRTLAEEVTGDIRSAIAGDPNRRGRPALRRPHTEEEPRH
jgi:nicotinate phosphoribosyltransferase